MKRIFAAFLLSAFFLITAAGTTQAARGEGTDMTLTFEAIEGDAIPELSGPIEVLAWSWGLERNDSDGKEKDGTPVKKGATMSHISITKYIGLDSPKLANMLLKGTNIKTVTLKTSSSSTENKITMKNAKMTSLSTGGSGGENRLTENISISFGEAEYQHTSLLNKKKPMTSSETLKPTK